MSRSERFTEPMLRLEQGTSYVPLAAPVAVSDVVPSPVPSIVVFPPPSVILVYAGSAHGHSLVQCDLVIGPDCTESAATLEDGDGVYFLEDLADDIIVVTVGR